MYYTLSIPGSEGDLAEDRHMEAVGPGFLSLPPSLSLSLRVSGRLSHSENRFETNTVAEELRLDGSKSDGLSERSSAGALGPWSIATIIMIVLELTVF